jgi:hypothetical protein
MVILFDQYNLPDDVFAIMFATEQQVEVAKLLVTEFKKNKGELDKEQMSNFATALHEGMQIKTTITVGPVHQQKNVLLSYNKRQFYDRILTPMKSMGMIDYDMYKKHYRLSERFAKSAAKLATMWTDEVKRSHNHIQKARVPLS